MGVDMTAGTGLPEGHPWWALVRYLTRIVPSLVIYLTSKCLRWDIGTPIETVAYYVAYVLSGRYIIVIIHLVPTTRSPHVVSCPCHISRYAVIGFPSLSLVNITSFIWTLGLGTRNNNRLLDLETPELIFCQSQNMAIFYNSSMRFHIQIEMKTDGQSNNWIDKIDLLLTSVFHLVPFRDSTLSLPYNRHKIIYEETKCSVVQFQRGRITE